MEESDDDDSDSEKEKKKLPPKKLPPKKKESSDSDDSDNDDDEGIKAKPPKKEEKKTDKKKSNKKQEDSEDEDSESEKKPKAKETKKKVEDSDEEDSESEKKPRAKETAKKEEDSEEEENKEEGDNKEGELPENAYEELFVRNIGFNTTQEELADFFQKYGDVEESKICTDKNTGKSKGFGFLKFYEKKSAVAAMNDADNIVVGGRNLQIRYSNDKNGPIKGGGNNSGNNGGKRGPSGSEFGIFVGNISYKCTENDLKKFFKDCGKVVDVRLAKKPDGKLKGFAHVDFETKEAVDKAVEKNGQELQGRALKVDRSERKGGAGGNNNRGGKGGRGRGREPVDPLAKARKSGGIIAPTENKVTTYDDSSDEE